MQLVIRDSDGNTIREMSDGQLKLVVGEAEVCVEEEDLEHELTERGLHDHLWH